MSEQTVEWERTWSASERLPCCSSAADRRAPLQGHWDGGGLPDDRSTCELLKVGSLPALTRLMVSLFG